MSSNSSQPQPQSQPPSATKRKSIIPLLPTRREVAAAAAASFTEKKITSAEKILIKFFDLLAFFYNLGKPLGNKAMEKCIQSQRLREIFDEHDTDKSGYLDADELYTVVLQFYLMVAQWTFVIARHIPSRKDVLSVITHADVNEDGLIGFEEFKVVMVLLCQGVATQLAAQTFFTVMLSPLLALGLLGVLKYLLILAPALAAQFWFIPGFLCNDKVGIMMCVPLCNGFILPYYLEYIFHIQSLRNPSKFRFVPDMSQFEIVKSSLSKQQKEQLAMKKMSEKEKSVDLSGESETMLVKVLELESEVEEHREIEKDPTHKKVD